MISERGIPEQEQLQGKSYMALSYSSGSVLGINKCVNHENKLKPFITVKLETSRMALRKKQKGMFPDLEVFL